jgi:hypothetical protein
MEQTCKNFEKCPIYSGILTNKEVTAKGYRKQFCEAGEVGWSACRRYQVKELTGKCPSDLLPNSFKTAEKIAAEMAK